MQPPMTKIASLLKLALVLVPIVLIFVGTAMIYFPAALIVAGVLLWLDLNRKGGEK